MQDALSVVRTLHWLCVGICLSMLFLAIPLLDAKKYDDVASSLARLSNLDFGQYYEFQNSISDNFHHSTALFEQIEYALRANDVRVAPDFVTLTIRAIPRSPHLSFGRSVPDATSSLRHINDYLSRNADRPAETFRFAHQESLEAIEKLAKDGKIGCVEHINFMGQTSANDDLYGLSAITGHFWRLGSECREVDEHVGNVRLGGRWIEVPDSSVGHWLKERNMEDVINTSEEKRCIGRTGIVLGRNPTSYSRRGASTRRRTQEKCGR